MKYYLVQVKTRKGERWSGVPVKEVLLCKECFHFHSGLNGKYRCEVTGNTVTKNDYCSRAEEREEWQE